MPPRPSSKVEKRAAPSKRQKPRRARRASSEEQWPPATSEPTKISQRSANTTTNTLAAQTSTVSPWRLRLAIDIGTTFTKASYQFYNEDTQLSTDPFHISWHGPHQYETPSILAYKDGKLYWGQQIETWLRDHKISEATVMRQAKLALHKYEDVGEASKVRAKVVDLLEKEGKDIFKLIADYMSALVIFAREYIHNTVAGKKHNSSTLPLYLSISVPQVWQPHSNVSLSNAAKALGVYSFEIVGEALCVAATVLEKELNSSGPDRWLEAGDRVVIADLGGGTGDFVLIELRDPILNGPQFGMITVQPASGGLCGAVFINHNFIDYLTSTHFNGEEELNRLAGEMGYDSETFLARASVAFEDAKKKFPDGGDHYYVIVHGKFKFRESWTMRLSKEQMEGFFDPVVQQIHAQIETMVADDPARVKCLILSGGLGKSVYVIEHMKERWAPTGLHVLFPREDHKGVVPEGALLRYTPGSIKPFGHDWSLCVVWSEDFDPKVHLDAVADENLVKRDPVDEDIDIVEARCMWIKNAVTGKARELWKLHYEPVIPGEGVVLRAEIFGTTSTSIQDHQALYLPHTKTLRPGIMKFHQIEYKMSEATLQAWDPVTSSDGEICYRIYACVVIRYDNDKIQFGIKTLLPRQENFDEEGNLTNSNEQEEFDDDDFSTIWDSKFSHVALETDPTARMPVSIAADAGATAVKATATATKATASSTPLSRPSQARASRMFIQEDDSDDDDYSTE